MRNTPFESAAKELDVVVDTVGGETLVRSFAVLKPGGVLVSSVSLPDQEMAARHRVRGVFFLVGVTSEGLARIASMIDDGRLSTCVGEVFPLSDARIAHEMLAGRPHKRPGRSLEHGLMCLRRWLAMATHISPTETQTPGTG